MAAATVNRDPTQYPGGDDAADAARLEATPRHDHRGEPRPGPNRSPSSPRSNGQTFRALLASGGFALEAAPFLDTTPSPLPPGFDFDRVEGMLPRPGRGRRPRQHDRGPAPARPKAPPRRDHPLPSQSPRGRPSRRRPQRRLPTRLLDSRAVERGRRPRPGAPVAPPDWPADLRHRPVGEGLRASLKDQGSDGKRRASRPPGTARLMRIAPVLVPHLAQPLGRPVGRRRPRRDGDPQRPRLDRRPASRSCRSCGPPFGSPSRPPRGFWLDRFLEVAGPLEGDTHLEPRFGPHAGRFKGSLTAVRREGRAPRLEAGRGRPRSRPTSGAPAPTCSRPCPPSSSSSSATPTSRRRRSSAP